MARLEGTDPTAPALLLMGHTDVVPANPADWDRDPFGGELVDGEVWGGGTVDILNLTASMTVATRHLAADGPRPRGSLLFLGVADEESGGAWGAHWLLDHAQEAVLHDVWRSFIGQAGLPPELAVTLLDPVALDLFLEAAPDVGLARMLHALTRTTISPTSVHSGAKTNIIPDRAEIDLDIRTLPGQTPDDIVGMVRSSLGDLAVRSRSRRGWPTRRARCPPTRPATTRCSAASSASCPGARVLPFMIMGGTDARFFRRHGATAYRAGLFSDRVPSGEFMSMFHGPNERIDQESLRLSTELWRGLVADLLG